MKIKVITVTDQPKNPGFLKLAESLDRHGWDWMRVPCEWKGFGTKVLSVYNACPDLLQKGYTHVLHTDAHDTYFLQSPFNMPPVKENIPLISTEKACWPDAHRASEYPDYYRGDMLANPVWRFVNSGQYLFPIKLFMEVVDAMPIFPQDDDQRWLTSVYLAKRWPIQLDYTCAVFQSIAFEAPVDFVTRGGRLKNRITNTYPIAVHGNGKTNMEWVYDLK